MKSALSVIYYWPLISRNFWEKWREGVYWSIFLQFLHYERTYEYEARCEVLFLNHLSVGQIYKYKLCDCRKYTDREIKVSQMFSNVDTLSMAFKTNCRLENTKKKTFFFSFRKILPSNFICNRNRYLHCYLGLMQILLYVSTILENGQACNCLRKVKMASVKIIHIKIAEIRIVKGLFA